MMVNVLVLDDDFFVGQIHARYVDEVPGFTALEPVRDLRTARDVIAENDVDLLLVDYVLPEGTGVDLVRETDIDAIVLSAVTDPQVVRSSLRAGAMTYIVKPFAAEVLQNFLRRYARFLRLLGAGEGRPGRPRTAAAQPPRCRGRRRDRRRARRDRRQRPGSSPHSRKRAVR
jgi:response regulator of citrate/malate metabolism